MFFGLMWDLYNKMLIDMLNDSYKIKMLIISCYLLMKFIKI